MKSPCLGSGRISPNFSQKELPSLALAEGRKGEFLQEKSLDGFAADAALSDSPPYCLLQPSETSHQEDFFSLRRMEQVPLPTVFPAQTMYCVQSAPYSMASLFHPQSGPPPPHESSCPPFGSDASYSRSPSFSPPSSSYSPIPSSSLAAKHSLFGPDPSSSFDPGTSFSPYPSEPPSYSSFRSFVSQVTRSVSPLPFEPLEHATGLTGLPRIGQYATPAESRSIQEIPRDHQPSSSHPPTPLSSALTTRSLLNSPVAPPSPLPNHPQRNFPLPVCSLILAPKSSSRPFSCHPCSKGFERSEHLTRHRATDSHLRTLKAKGIPCFEPPVNLTRCPFCEHKFNRSDNLNPHLITHMHSRPEGKGRGSKGVSVEEVARSGFGWIDPRVNPKVKVARKVTKGGGARVRRR